MPRLLQRIVIAILALAAIIYVADYAIWHIRNASGNAMSTIQVDTYLSTPLKGNKAEYDYLGTQPEPCARALFPHGGAPACWWLARHTQQWE
jgi:hypothetical protein